MPKPPAKSAPTSPKKIATRTVTFTQTLQPNVYDALCLYRQHMGMNDDQDVVRIAVAQLLKREGYLIN